MLIESVIKSTFESPVVLIALMMLECVGCDGRAAIVDVVCDIVTFMQLK